jgi:hypothetical protein
MIACEEALEAAVLDADEIDPVTRDRLEAHLLACAACAAEAGRMRRTLDLLRAGEAPDPGAEYWRTFDARLRGRILRARSVTRWRGVASLAAAAIAIAGLWVWTAGHRGAPGPSPPGDAGPGSVGRVAEAGESGLDAGDGGLDAAESRLEQAINRLALQEQGERSFEAVLDEVLPAAPPGFDAEPDKQGIETPRNPDNC